MTEEIAEVGGGLAVIEVGPDAVNEVFEGTPWEFRAGEVSGLKAAGGNVIEAAQEVAPVVAVAAFVYVGFKTMARGLKSEQS